VARAAWHWLQLIDSAKEQAIREAVSRLLALCYKADVPIVTLARALQDLKDEGWAHDDVRRVESTVMKMLIGMMTDDRNTAADETTMD
jgi:hypothetical protein